MHRMRRGRMFGVIFLFGALFFFSPDQVLAVGVDGACALSGSTGFCKLPSGCNGGSVLGAGGGCDAGLICCKSGSQPAPAPVPPVGGGTAACSSSNVCQSGTCKTGYSPATGTCSAAGYVCCSLTVTPTGSSVNFFNPLKFSTVDGVLTSVLESLQGIVVVLAIIFIIIGALIYITSAGNDGRMTLAKGAIMAALIGLALALAAPSFLKEIGSILGWTDVNNATVASAQTFTQIASKVLSFLLSIAGIIAIIMLVFGGFTYLTSAGDEGRAEMGKKISLYAVIGIALALAALVLVTQVAKLFV